MQRDTFRVQIVAGRAYIVGEMRSYQTRQWHLKIQIQEVGATHMALHLSSFSTWKLACNQFHDEVLTWLQLGRRCCGGGPARFPTLT